MKAAEVAAALDHAEASPDLRGTGFWKAVSAVRRQPELVDEFADRIGTIDRRAFEAGVRLRVPAWVGTLVLAGGTAGGVAAVVLCARLDGVWKAVVFLAGFGAITVASHSLAHWVVGRAMGMRFTHYFLGGPPPPRPGAKLDYGSYLRVAPRRRAVMHASGAVVTKLVPFVLLPVAWGMGMRAVAGVLVAVGVLQIVTDVVLSTKSSDWKKVRRELRAARAR